MARETQPTRPEKFHQERPTASEAKTSRIREREKAESAEPAPEAAPPLPEAELVELPPLLEPAEYDHDDISLQVHEDPTNGGFFTVLSDKNDPVSQRAALESRLHIGAELQRKIGRGQIDRQRPVSRVSEAEVVYPRENYASEALRIALQEGSRLVAAEEEAQRMFERGFEIKNGMAGGIIYEQPLSPESVYGVALDRRGQALPPVAWEQRTSGEVLLDTIESQVKNAIARGRTPEEVPVSSYKRWRRRLGGEALAIFDRILNQAAELRLQKPMESLQNDREFAALVEEAETEAADRRGADSEAMSALRKLLLQLGQGSQEGRYALVDAFILEEKSLEATRAASRSYSELLGLTLESKTKQGFLNGLEKIRSDGRYGQLNPDARLALSEKLKKMFAESVGSLDDQMRQAIEELREPELGAEKTKIDEAERLAQNFLDKKTGRLAPEGAARFRERLPALSETARIALYDRLQRNGLLEPGSKEAELMLSEKKMRIIASGNEPVRLFAVDQEGNVEDLSAAMDENGQELDIDLGGGKTTKARSLNLPLRAGATIVLGDRELDRADVADSWQAGEKPADLRGALAKLGRRVVVIKST